MSDDDYDDDDMEDDDELDDTLIGNDVSLDPNKFLNIMRQTLGNFYWKNSIDFKM